MSSRISSERQWADAQGFPWSQILHSMLSECFRLHSFRPGQLEAINCVSHQTQFFLQIFPFKSNTFPSSPRDFAFQVLAGNDVFLVMAAGAGKSLVYVISSSFIHRSYHLNSSALAFPSYQLPSLVACRMASGRSKITLIISPLVALMKDQVELVVINNHLAIHNPMFFMFYQCRALLPQVDELLRLGLPAAR